MNSLRDEQGRFRAQPIARAWRATWPPIGWMIVGALVTLAAMR
jgi:hypothetical protein